jgi:hypothetical protein
MGEALDDPVLGHLIWDDEFDWWCTMVELRSGHQIDVIIDYDREFYEGINAREARLLQARDGCSGSASESPTTGRGQLSGSSRGDGTRKSR